MANTGSKFFTVMVVGDDPEGLMKKYDKALKVKPYIKYKYLDAEKIQKSAIKVLSGIVENSEKLFITDDQKNYFKHT